jgi:2-hydroxychromene-2-carboxylate isomerase
MPVMAEQNDRVRFYFSFRSPYSWLAFLRIERALAGLPVKLDYLPVFPPPNFPNDPAAVPNKLSYIQKDVARIAEAYGFATKPLQKLDCDWVRPHAAFVYAADQSKGREFGRAAYEARFVHGCDLGDDAVLAETARVLELDPVRVIDAAGDKAYQTRVVQGMIQGAQEDAIFGVPYFVYRREAFWGNDRIEWLMRAIRKAHGMPVVDLSDDWLRALDR